MTLIEGVGDEVTQFAAIVILVLVAALAWWSTNARPDRYRTVLVMRPRTHHRVISVHTRPSSSLQVAQNSSMPTPTVTSSDVAPNANVEESLEPTPRETRVIPVQEMDSIVDADMAMMDHNRLHFYRRLDETPETVNETSSEESEASEESELASNAQISEMESIVRAMEADIVNDSNASNRSQETTTETQSNPKPSKELKPNNKANSNPLCNNTPNNQVINENNGNNIVDDRDISQGDTPVEENRKDPRTILIKLKYLNDTFKEVEGSLDELLKDFKWRHFSNELSAANRVRLIFNGRVLGDEAATLAALGLHHRAVVHCLVHPPRNNPQRVVPEEATLAPPELVAEAPQPERSWDLENVLMTLVSIALTIVWFFRCEYSNMFTASASVALFGLTVFYSMAIFGLYLSDTFHVDRRRAPAPTLNQNQPASAN